MFRLIGADPDSSRPGVDYQNPLCVLGSGWRKCVGVEPAQSCDAADESERLGHSTISNALDLYSRVIPSMQREAAAALDDVLAAGR